MAASPAFCGHEFVNPSPDEMVGNLVFATLPFDAKLYIRADDSRQRKGSAPFRFDTEDEWTELAASADAQRLVRLPMMQGRMSLLLVRREYTLSPASSGPTLLYVMRGAVDVKAGAAGRTVPTK